MMNKLMKLTFLLLSVVLISGCMRFEKTLNSFQEINQDYMEQNQNSLSSKSYLLLICDSTNELCIKEKEIIEENNRDLKFYLDVYPYMANINRADNDSDMREQAILNYRLLLAKYNLTSIPTLLVFSNGQIIDDYKGFIRDKLYDNNDNSISNSKKASYLAEAETNLKIFVDKIHFKQK